jgi:selenocysteine-specific elongation factor
MFVIGTAGHVDHGKSTLVKALTNIDPDRLPEEKEREMTVDLGFAWCTLPSGREISIVDVPGHERFIKNMLAGVGAIDLALLIVAADESVMPQTREHLAILDILQIKRGLIVITKSDLVDEELVELVQAEIEDTVKGTCMEGRNVVSVSAYTGEGLDILKQAIDETLNETDVRQDLGRPRLPIDRCFSISGFGTVVTGTLIDGTLTVGQEVELATTGQRCRIRGLQSHKSQVDSTDPGVRLAVNLSGVPRQDVTRGEIITVPGWLTATRRLDARLRMVKRAPHPLRHNHGVTFHLFTSETTARVRLLDTDKLEPDTEGWVQILLDESIPVVKGDFFVIRSAEETLGGGQIVEPYPRRRHRRFDSNVLEQLMILDQGSGEDILVSVADQWGPCTLDNLSQRSNLAKEEIIDRISTLERNNLMIILGDLSSENDAVVYSAQGWTILASKIRAILQSYHNQYPLRKGAPTQELRSRLDIQQQVYLKVLGRLVEDSVIEEKDQYVHLPDHLVVLSPDMAIKSESYLKILEEDLYSPPTDQAPDPELLAAMVEMGKVVKVNESVVFSALAYDQLVENIKNHIVSQGSITVADARTMFNTSRKYILPLLEYLDQQRITQRIGDERVLR